MLQYGFISLPIFNIHNVYLIIYSMEQSENKLLSILAIYLSPHHYTLLIFNLKNKNTTSEIGKTC